MAMTIPARINRQTPSVLGNFASVKQIACART